jgi:hypothetical protein
VIPLILVGGMMTGWFTPTEAGVIAVVYILVVVIPFLNIGHLKRLPRDFCHAGLIYSLPLITIGAASAFGWMLAYLRGPIVVSGWISEFAGNDPAKIMFALVLLFTIVGDFIEPVPCIVIFMPIVVVLTEAGGINSVHMGVVLIVTLAFGLITPPYGLALLMASKFIGVRFSQALRASLSIYVVFFLTIRGVHLRARDGAVPAPPGVPGIDRLLQEPERARLYLPLTRPDRDVVDQPGTFEMGGGQQARPAVECNHWQQIGSVAQLEIIDGETGPFERRDAGGERRCDRIRPLPENLGGVGQHLMELRRHPPFVGREINIAGGQREPVRLAHRRHPLDPHRDVEIARQAAHHHQLLVILLAEEGGIRQALQQ